MVFVLPHVTQAMVTDDKYSKLGSDGGSEDLVRDVVPIELESHRRQTGEEDCRRFVPV